MKESLDFTLYFITDSSISKKPDEVVAEEALKAGVKVIQYREKLKSGREMLKTAKKIRGLCTDYGACFIVNDRIDVAYACDADGVHLGQWDLPIETARRIMPGKIVGLSATNVKEAIEAQERGADYIGLGPIWATQTKKDAAMPIGPEMIARIKRKVRIPVVAIGGINEGNMVYAKKAGADGVAMISAIVTQEDVYGTCKRILSLLKAV